MEGPGPWRGSAEAEAEAEDIVPKVKANHLTINYEQTQELNRRTLEFLRRAR